MKTLILRCVLLCSVTCTALGAKPHVDDFVITVWKPAGWTGGNISNENRDVSFTADVDADSLSSLGIDLLVSTPSLVTVPWVAPDTSQGLEERIMERWYGYGGYAVEWAPESASEGADNWALLDYAGYAGSTPLHCGGKYAEGLLLPDYRDEMDAKVQALVAKWDSTSHDSTFWGYLIGHEFGPHYTYTGTITDSSTSTGGIYGLQHVPQPQG